MEYLLSKTKNSCSVIYVHEFISANYWFYLKMTRTKNLDVSICDEKRIYSMWCDGRDDKNHTLVLLLV